MANQLTQLQIDEAKRLEDSLESLWAWAESLDDEQDGRLLVIVQNKIGNLLRKIDSRICNALICTNCGTKAPRPVHECGECGEEFGISN